MIELLVALGVLALAMGSILSIFVAGSRFGARAQARIEAGRAARAVFGLADRGAGSPVTWGRDAYGQIEGVDAPAGINNLSVAVPPKLTTSPLPIVWEAEIRSGVLDPAVFAVGLYLLEVRTYFDEDGDGQPSGDDREIGSYRAILSNR